MKNDENIPSKFIPSSGKKRKIPMLIAEKNIKINYTNPKSSGKVEEIGGPKGPEPTRYGDWVVNGRCTDF